MRHLLTASLATAGLVAANALGAAAQDAETTKVLQSELEGEKGTEANIVRFDVGPDWETERHIHPGHVFVYVLEGSIELDVEGAERQTYTADEAFYELPDKPMVARTAGTEDGAKFIVFQIGPTGEPIMVAQPE